jgi:hypothetical protein
MYIPPDIYSPRLFVRCQRLPVRSIPTASMPALYFRDRCVHLFECSRRTFVSQRAADIFRPGLWKGSRTPQQHTLRRFLDDKARTRVPVAFFPNGLRQGHLSLGRANCRELFGFSHRRESVVSGGKMKPTSPKFQTDDRDRSNAGVALIPFQPYPRASACISWRRSARPGRSPVGFPSLQTRRPLTKTCAIPAAGSVGSVKVARSMTVSGSNTVMSA